MKLVQILSVHHICCFLHSSKRKIEPQLSDESKELTKTKQAHIVVDRFSVDKLKVLKRKFPKANTSIIVTESKAIHM